MRDHRGDIDLDVVRALFPGARVDPVARLRSGERSTVLRVRLREGDGERTVVVKQFRTAGEGWVRETAALAALTASTAPGASPALLAEDPAHGVVVMADLGAGPTLADALLGDDPAAAASALCGWSESVARLHSVARPLGERFAAQLTAREGDLPVARSRMTADLADAAAALPERCLALGVGVPDGAVDELRGLARRLAGRGAVSMSPADTCPDNAVLGDSGYRLLDFEGAQWRSVVWDVAYLTVPWPTCWCSWLLPADVADRAVAAYRSAAAAAVPEVLADTFTDDLAAATAGWALASVTWFLDGALQADVDLRPDRPTPTRRASVLHRLRLAADTGQVPALAELAGRLADELEHRWGSVPLPLAPAFRAAR